MGTVYTMVNVNRWNVNANQEYEDKLNRLLKGTSLRLTKFAGSKDNIVGLFNETIEYINSRS
jgi:hypothetical protein